MVSDYPKSRFGHKYGSEPTFSLEPEHVAAYVAECTKGDVGVPTLVHNNDELYKKYKTRLTKFFASGGKSVWIVRAAVGTPIKAMDKIYDNSATPVEVLRLIAKRPGSYAIYVTISSDSNGNLVTIKEDGYNTERYANITTIKRLVEKINAESELVDAEYFVNETSAWAGSCEAGQTVNEGSSLLALVTEKQLGAGTGNTAGTDGTVKEGSTIGELPDETAPAAHELALTKIELLDNPEPAVVFTNKNLLTVHAKYGTHAVNMSDSLRGKWRLAVIGAMADATIDQRAAAAKAFNEEEILYVGHSLYDQDGNLHPSNEMSEVVAGKLCSTKYGDAIWGGEKEKVLGIDGNPYFSELGEVFGEDEIILLNEAGVITFVDGKYGISIREGVTTAQANKSETDDDEVCVVRIVQHALRKVKEAADEMKGVKITETYDTDLERACANELDIMKDDDKTLTEIPEEGLSAYDIEVSSIPRKKQREGRIDIRLALTVTHVARQLFGDITIR